MKFCDSVGDPSYFPSLADCLCLISFSCVVVEKGGFWAPDLYGEGMPQILDMRFQIALTSDHVADFR